MITSNIAITGGAGFVGAALANELSKHGNNKIKLLDNLSSGDWSRLDDNFESFYVDISNASVDELVNMLSGVDTLFHLSAVKLHNEKNTFHDLITHNILGTQRILEAAGLAGVKSLVFTSSLYAYGMPNVDVISEKILPSPSTIYGASKLFGEYLVSIAATKYAFKYAIARLFFIYGEKQYAEGGYKSVIVNNFERLKLGIPAIINGDGTQILDYLHVSDCVEALIQLASKPTNDIFNVSSGLPLSINDLTNQMCQITGINNSTYGPSDWTQGTRRVGSHQKLKSLTGWSPKVNLQEGLRRTWSSLN